MDVEAVAAAVSEIVAATADDANAGLQLISPSLARVQQIAHALASPVGTEDLLLAMLLAASVDGKPNGAVKALGTLYVMC